MLKRVQTDDFNLLFANNKSDDTFHINDLLSKVYFSLLFKGKTEIQENFLENIVLFEYDKISSLSKEIEEIISNSDENVIRYELSNSGSLNLDGALNYYLERNCTGFLS